jgi:D-methionine transport system ATP-binding protein
MGSERLSHLVVKEDNVKTSDEFIRIEELRKTFKGRESAFEVLKGVNLTVERGMIAGIVGFSGAGKTTLIRCVNRLETPDAGRIIVGETDVTALSPSAPAALTAYRRRVGIIFQQFNLLDSRTVFGNVAFPLELAQWRKKDIKSRVAEILELVGLADKHDAYPGQLSGGQKQRVGIARALANRPDLLLSDEATSALDPLTSLSILDLLIDINRKLGLTIVLITHELDVVRYACARVAVLEDGVIAEEGSVRRVFQEPHSETARLFMKINRDLASRDWQDGSGI